LRTNGAQATNAPATANRLALALITVGVVVSSVILLALLNLHIA
jgi:hypothetical protein